MEWRQFVVLDRDGTIIEERVYLSDPKQLVLIRGAADALRRLRAMGFGLIVITNQSAVGRGFFDEAQLTRIHQEFSRILEAERVQLDGIYFCPHKPEDQCSCRKPAPGLIKLASEELRFDLKSSIVIGDKACDIEMGHRVGATTFLVRTGYGAQSEQRVAADYVVDDLSAAVAIIKKLPRNERNVIHDH
ncbi:MAG: D-glycero-beta-D-manno-heptose 1,7-bisphosphate 7-phosphatase [Candidatus Binatia bacterium]